MRENLFALDCGSTNWRLYRATYETTRQSTRLLGEPQPASLTSFIERRLPTVILLNKNETELEDLDEIKLESFGETVYQFLYDETMRPRIRDFFKPCIGAHLEQSLLPHQNYTHEEALTYTRLLLQNVLEQLRLEKWRSRPFDENIRFAFSYPVYWRDEHGGKIFEIFKEMVLGCLPDGFESQLNFVTEPEAAILGLQHQKVLTQQSGTILLIDVGGSTTDLTAGHLNPRTGQLEGVHRYGEPHGGGLYDQEIAQYLAERLKIPEAELDNDPSAMHLLRMFARQLKEALSRQLLMPFNSNSAPQKAITIMLKNGQIYRKTISLDEEQFLEITRNLRGDFEYLIDNGLRRMHLREQNIAQVVLVGGGAQLFSVVRHLQNRFGKDRISLADNSPETVVYGLALEYGRAFGEAQPWLSPPSYNSIFEQPMSEKEDTDINASPAQFPPPANPFTEIPTLLDVSDTPDQDEWKLIRNNGEIYPIEASRPLKIGRRRTNAIVISDDQASRNHAQVELTPTGCQITDLGSSNGTFVNGIRLLPKRPQELQPGDEIQIGRTRLICEQ